MAIDRTTRTKAELQNLVDNHRRKGATDAPLYLDALRELGKRKAEGLDFDTSYRLILEAARQDRFLSYKDLADGSGVDWNQVHYSVSGHLRDLVEYAHRKGWPMLSAVVVNKPNVATGKMEPETLKGFVAAAQDLGYEVDDEEEFLAEQQRLVFAWARSVRGGHDP